MAFLNLEATIESILGAEENMGILEKKFEESSCCESDVQAELHTAPAPNLSCLGTDLTRATYNTQIGGGAYNPQIQAVGTITTGGDFTMGPKIIGGNVTYIQGGTGKKQLRENGPISSGLFVSSLSSTRKGFPPAKLVGETIALKFPPVKLVGETTALKFKKMIEDCLMDDKVRTIGVFGMGGVGKTTIMTQICNKIRNENTFNMVIWVTVSKDSYLEKLQYDVSKSLGINLSNDCAIGRSAELIGAFSHLGRFLVILDDMWDAFPLDKIGIPEPNEENKCKIVWTTRSKKVCRGMGSDKAIKVEGLTKDESWTLFKEKLRATNISLELETIAKDVVEECDGLPLAIITVGAAMRDVDDISEWRNALNELRNSSAEMIEGMEDKVFKSLKFSFDLLKTQRLRDCFLYCALFPEDFQIYRGWLIEYWMADGLLDEIEDHEKGFDKGSTIINHLKDACMLENGNDGYVKMHDLLRDLAIDITKRSPKFVVKAGFKVKRLSWGEDLITNAIRVSFMESNILKLSCQPKSCHELSTLLLKCSYLEDIHHLFFEEMHNLRVLDLSFTKIMCLPLSISNLGKLRALLLAYCYRLEEVPSLAKLIKLRVLKLSCCCGLEEVPSLAKLKELRELDLSGTSIRSLPEGLEGLTNLRCLNLGFQPRTLPAGIIRNLSCLEDLTMDCCEVMVPSNENEGGACMEEMLTLVHLRKLYVNYFADLNAFNFYVRSGHWRNLKLFRFQIGDKDVNEGDEFAFDDAVLLHGRERSVKIRSIRKCMSSLLLPDNTLHLTISGSNDMTSLSEIPSMWSLKQLTTFGVRACKKMEYVLTKDQNNPFLPNLNELSIFGLLNLRIICKDPMPIGGGSLANLKTINIRGCPNLKYVFSVGWLQALQNLEVIKVRGHGISMNEMEEMVVETEDMGESSNNNDNTITLPRLRILKLQNLWKLKSISKRIFVCNSLKEIKVDSCRKLKKLPLSINRVPSSLKSIRGSNQWWDSLEWDNSDIQLRLQCFFSSKNDTFSTEDEDDGTSEDEHDGTNEDDVAAHEEEEKHGTKRKAEALM